MKNLKTISFLLFFLISGLVNAQNEFYNKEFNWKINIPDNFENFTEKEWEKIQQKGKAAIEKSTGQKVINQSKTILVFRTDQLNYFEANYQPFNPAKDGSYSENIKFINKTLTKTFIDNIPGCKVSSEITKEKINGLEFYKIYMKIIYPNKIVFHSYMYSRLFGKKDFSANIMFIDEDKGKIMLENFKNSTFK